MTTLVLVHGAFHGPWCFTPLISALAERGISTLAPELPLTSLAADVAAVTDALDQHGGPVAMLGHSYGGAVITEAGNHPSVHRLIYLAAMAPDTGEGVSGGPVEIGARFLEHLRPSEDGRLEVAPEHAVDLFYPDADPAEAAQMAALIRPGNTGVRGERIERAAWRDRTTDYIVCADDPIVLTNGQRALAARLGATTHEIAGDHSPFLARPGELADLLVRIVGA